MTREPQHLQNPNREELAELLRELSNHEACKVSVTADRLAQTLCDAESVGLVGMVAHVSKTDCEISACKAKQGPCFDTGRIARYLGAAAAVLDDDNHLIVGDIAVCEKTARVYEMAQYQSLVEVSPADPELRERLDSDPVVFDCNTYERDLRTLLASLDNIRSTMESRTAVFYPGPFRLLITDDGTMIRRGEAEYLSESQAEKLITEDACIRIDPGADIVVTKAEYLADAVAQRGSLCLLGELPLTSIHAGPAEPDLHSLVGLSEETARRLLVVIESDDPMFVLTGSDPNDPDGCCPSPEVGEALMLVEAGILEARRSPTVPDGCPVMAVAFSGELRDGKTGIESIINRALRKAVHEKLT